MRLRAEDRGTKEYEERVLRARGILKDYCVSPAHYRYHKGLKGIAYNIPMEVVDERVSNAILMLLHSRKVLMGISNGMYVLYQNSNEDVLTFATDLVHCNDKVEDLVRAKWEDIFKGEKKFYITFSMKRYFEEDGISDALDELMLLDNRVVLSMVYSHNLTLMLLKDL